MLARNIYRSSSTARAGPSLVSHMAGYRTSSPAWGASVTAAEQPSTSRSTVDHQQLPFADIQRHSGWRVDGKESLTRENFYSVLANKLSYISVPEFLSADECSRLVNVIETHEISSYNDNVYPKIGSVGITQFDNQRTKEKYFAGVDAARSLQRRFAHEVEIDIVARVQDALQKVTEIPVRVAREGSKEYFAGLLRLINNSALIHADYAPYDSPSWKIGRIIAQLSWNILLKDVRGGSSIVYNRPWRGPRDEAFKLPQPSYGFLPSTVAGCEQQVISPKAGELALFNSRNFHEVKPLDRTHLGSRYTFSSFVGLLPASEAEGPMIIMWS